MLNEYIDKKLKYKNKTVFISALLCGVGVGFVTTFAISLNTMTQNAVINKLIYGTAFTALLLLIILNGYDLFTGNTMLLTVVHKKENTKRVLLNLVSVYFGNLIGCIAIAYIIKLADIHETFSLSYYLEKTFTTKTQLSIFKMLLLGLFANYFVCMGVFLASKAKTIVETYLSLFFPICIFCVLGFEHSVANMFTLTYALFVNKLSILPLLLNISLVTLGNILGGYLFALSTKIKSTTPQPSQSQS